MMQPIAYAKPIFAESTKLCLELSAATLNTHGAAHENLIEHFGVRESEEISSLATLLDAFLAFFG